MISFAISTRAPWKLRRRGITWQAPLKISLRELLHWSANGFYMVFETYNSTEIHKSLELKIKQNFQTTRGRVFTSVAKLIGLKVYFTTRLLSQIQLVLKKRTQKWIRMPFRWSRNLLI